MSKPIFEDPFRFSGRRNRKSYILYSLAIFAALVGVIVSLDRPIATGPYGEPAFDVGHLALMGLAFILFVVSSGAVGAQRCRDFGWSGWAILITLIPYVGPAFVLALWFIPRTPGDNRYGDDPIS